MAACSLVLVIKSSERRTASDIEVLKAVVINTICFWAVAPCGVAYSTSVWEKHAASIFKVRLWFEDFHDKLRKQLKVL